MDNIEAVIEDIKLQYWFDTMTWGLPIVENILQFKTDLATSIEDRRSQIEARWKSNGKADIYLLQSVANSWKNGDVSISFVDGKIKVIFMGEMRSNTTNIVLYKTDPVVDKNEIFNLIMQHLQMFNKRWCIKWNGDINTQMKQ